MGLFVLGAIFGLYIGIGGFAVLASARSGSSRLVVPVLTYSVLFMGWVLVPLFGFGVDETLDPDRLALLPLRRSELMRGLLAASCVGIGPAATLVAVCGSLVSHSHSWWTLGVLLAVALEFLMCVVVARALTTSLARLMRSRRLRDVAAIVVSILGVAVGVLGQLPRLLGGSVSSHAALTLARALRWTPPGMAGHVLLDADKGEIVPVVLELAACAAFVLVLLVAWSVNLDRLLTTVAPGEVQRERSAARPSGHLFPKLVRFLPRTRIGAVAAKDLRLVSREPLMRSQRLLTGMFAVGGLVAVALLPRLRHPEAVLASAALLWWFNAPALNQFAPDRAAYWMNAVATGDPRDDLLGKNVAGLVLHVPIFVAVAIGAAALTDGWAYLPVAACLAVAVLGAQFAVGNVTSVRVAQPLPDSTTNPWAVRSGQGLESAFVLMGALFLTPLILAPVIALVLIGVTKWSPLLWIAAPVCIGYGVLLYAAGLRLAGGWLRAHEPELLDALSPSKAA